MYEHTGIHVPKCERTLVVVAVYAIHPRFFRHRNLSNTGHLSKFAQPGSLYRWYIVTVFVYSAVREHKP